MKILWLVLLILLGVSWRSDAGMMLGGGSVVAPSFPYQVNVTDTLQTAGTPPYQVGVP